MHPLSTVLIVLAGLAAVGLLYEFAAEHRREGLRARINRERQELAAHPVYRARTERDSNPYSRGGRITS